MNIKKISKLVKFYRKRLTEEEEIYNEKLTSLDKAVHAIAEDKPTEVLWRLKNSLNQIYRTSDVQMVSERFPELIRRIINWGVHVLLGPFFKAQNEFNAQTVHFINEYMQFTEDCRKKQIMLNNALMQFNQRIIALIDVKVAKASHESVKLLLELRKSIEKDINGLQETLMISYEGLDRKLLSFMSHQMNLQRKLSDIEDDSFEVDVFTESARGNYPVGYGEDEESSALYLAFENKYRGPERLIKKRFKKYLNKINSQGKILDIGCGRGEFLELLKENEMEGYGVDNNSEMVRRCKEKNLNVIMADAFEYLSKAGEESVSTIMCSHVIEHLPHYRWYEFLQLCKKVLIQEGNLIIETLNPRSLYGLIEWYWKDPTHQHPVYPEYLQYLMEIIGFNNISINYLTPVPSNVALLTEQQENLVYEENINRLNTFLHDTIEYYMVAKK